MTDERIIIAIYGGTASGKTTLAESIRKTNSDMFSVLPLDSYFKCNAYRSASEIRDYNFDHPDAMDFDLFALDLEYCKNENVSSIETPIYDFKSASRLTQKQEIKLNKIILIEGILCLHTEEVRKLIDYSIFVDTPDNVRFNRKMNRDIIERGRTKEHVIDDWKKYAIPMHDKFCEPTKVYAQKIIDGTNITKSEIVALSEEIIKFSSS